MWCGSGMVWCRIVCYGMVLWYGIVWCSIVWYGMVCGVDVYSLV